MGHWTAGVVAICGSSVDLTGTVSTVEQSQRALRAAWGIPGVTTFRNGIHILH